MRALEGRTVRHVDVLACSLSAADRRGVRADFEEHAEVSVDFADLRTLEERADAGGVVVVCGPLDDEAEVRRAFGRAGGRGALRIGIDLPSGWDALVEVSLRSLPHGDPPLALRSLVHRLMLRLMALAVAIHGPRHPDQLRGFAAETLALPELLAARDRRMQPAPASPLVFSFD